MTRAPDSLLAVRRLLLAELGPHGLGSLEVGIVGDTAHISQGDSYHLGLPEQRTTGYSVSESSRDTAGLSEYASALDVGTFAVGSHNLRTFSKWIVAQCVAGAPDTRDIREIIYSSDGQTVKRWDRLGKRSSGDSSHLIHTHFSFFRDSTKAGRDLTPLFRRYLTTIGLLEDAVTPAEFLTILRDPAVAAEMSRLPWAFKPADHEGWTAHGIVLNSHTATLAALAQNDGQDVQAIVAGVLAGLTPEQIAQAIPAQLARDVADELARRMAS